MHLLQAKAEKATPQTKWKEYTGMALLKYITAFSFCVLCTYAFSSSI